MDSTGYVWTTSIRVSERYRSEVWSSPADGSPSRLVSAQLPPELFASSSVVGAHGRFIGGNEVFDDGAYHGSIWRVNDDGSAHPVACDPSPQASVRLAASSPDAIYWVVVTGGTAWTIAKAPQL